MRIVKKKIKDLKPAEYNPRYLTDRQEEDLTESLTKFGLCDPIIINKNKERKNIVIGGHQRLKIWEKLGNTEIPCVELDLSEDDEKELNVRLNKNTGDFDFKILKAEFEVDSLLEWGFEDYELGIGDFEEQKIAGEEKPKAEEVEVSAGDLWRLGDHYIIVGEDSVKPITDAIKKWNKLDAGDEAELIDDPKKELKGKF